jgi:hypothetical protein
MELLKLRRIALCAGALAVTAGLVYLSRAVGAISSSGQPAASGQTQAIMTATTALLNALNPEQRHQVQFPFIAEKSAHATKFARTGPSGGPPNGPRGGAGGPGMGPMGGFVGEQYGKAVWSNYPVSDVPRPGLRLSDLSPAQRGALMHLLQVALSSRGYQKILEIMGSDQALHESGTPFCSGTDCYTIGIFGEPSASGPWMLEFGGHHLGLNLIMNKDHGVITPTLTGAQPAVYTSNGKTVRVLAAENDKAFALLDALDEKQKKQAILNYSIGDLVLGPGHAGEVIQAEGLKASAMSAQQRALLLDVISEWASIVNNTYAKARMEEIKAGLDDTWFSWSGPTTHEPGRNGSAYYRIQGPKVIIEFSPQGVGGDSTMHVHTMYRDPTNDYGIQFNGAE